MAIPADLITGALSFLVTLLIFSYLIGDNPLFRVGAYVFVGSSAGYIAAVAFWQALYPKMLVPLMQGDLLQVVPLLMAALILMKVSPRLAGLASFAMAFIVGVGAAITIVGAVSGTLMPQVEGTLSAFSLNSAYLLEMLINGLTILAGVVLSLAYFHFGARPSKKDGELRRFGLIELMAWGGRVFIGSALGAVFAGVFSAALTAFIERVHSLFEAAQTFLRSFGIF